jgi:hypothetical protein
MVSPPAAEPWALGVKLLESLLIVVIYEYDSTLSFLATACGAGDAWQPLATPYLEIPSPSLILR